MVSKAIFILLQVGCGGNWLIKSLTHKIHYRKAHFPKSGSESISTLLTGCENEGSWNKQLRKEILKSLL